MMICSLMWWEICEDGCISSLFLIIWWKWWAITLWSYDESDEKTAASHYFVIIWWEWWEGGCITALMRFQPPIISSLCEAALGKRNPPRLAPTSFRGCGLNLARQNILNFGFGYKLHNSGLKRSYNGWNVHMTTAKTLGKRNLPRFQHFFEDATRTLEGTTYSI